VRQITEQYPSIKGRQMILTIILVLSVNSEMKGSISVEVFAKTHTVVSRGSVIYKL
jgi:hypothetical protein